MARSRVLLPLPLGAQQHEELALADLDGNVVDDGLVLIPLGDLVEGDGHAGPARSENRRPCYQRPVVARVTRWLQCGHKAVLRPVELNAGGPTTNEYTFWPSHPENLPAWPPRTTPLMPSTRPPPKRRERPHWVLDDAVYSISALLLSVIVMHSIWTLIIRPRAEAVLSQRVTVTNSQQRQGAGPPAALGVRHPQGSRAGAVRHPVHVVAAAARPPGAGSRSKEPQAARPRLREDRRQPGGAARRRARVFAPARGAAPAKNRTASCRAC